MDIAYDIETYPNCFLICFQVIETGQEYDFEISEFRTDNIHILRNWIGSIGECGRMVGFNNVRFDYPLVHYAFTHPDPQSIYAEAQRIITTDDRWNHQIAPFNRLVTQLDLFLIHHFDNKAKATGLKALEFSMRLPNISDLPFPVGTYLTRGQIEVLREYCKHDVAATIEFYHRSKEQIRLREQLSLKHDVDMINYSDVRIGRKIFELNLMREGIQLYTRDSKNNRFEPRQTQRPAIVLAECIPDCVRFESKELQDAQDVISKTVIANTKSEFTLTVPFQGIKMEMGTGGLHASVSNTIYRANDEFMIYDLDVTSLYPSIAIEHDYYPEHLGSAFVDVYRQLRTERIKYPKGTAENAALKLALNGVYGLSNNIFSPFFDPLFTMRITIGGQLMIAMLAERLQAYAKIIQINTDGITLWMPRTNKIAVDTVCWGWESETRLKLEYAEFDFMAIADVNSYLARTVDGKVKRKGRYDHDLEWHQDASALVVPKVAEKVLLEDAPVTETVRNWPDPMDFMLRVKAKGKAQLFLDLGMFDLPLERTQRYYVSEGGGQLFKLMPPLAKKPNEWRRIGVHSGFKVCPCNDIKYAELPIDFNWYINEVHKLTLRMK